MADIKISSDKKNHSYDLPLINAAKDGDLEGVISSLKNGADVNYGDENQQTALYLASRNGHAEIVQLLLKYNADPNICDNDQETALHQASYNGHTEIVQLLLQHQADPNICNKDQETALHHASYNGLTKIALLLLQHQADPNICNKDQQTALYWASYKGHTEIVQLLLQYNSNPNTYNEDQWTALYWASINGHTKIVQLLLRHQADPNICNKDQETALYWASRNGHTEIVQLLLQYKADPNICNKDQETALHWASCKSYTEIVQLLLKYNADPNICNKDQWTALYWASSNGHTEIVQLLLQHQADPNICNKDRVTALYWASRNGHTEIVQLLLQHQADPNICDKDQETALRWASCKGHTEIVQLLLKYNADPNICNKDQETALHCVFKNGPTKIVQLLLQHQADPNICNKDQWTALYWASSNGHTEIVQLLLQYKADPNIYNKDQRTALFCASFNGHTEIVQLLLQHQADPNICNKNQWTPLYWASTNGHTDIVQLLLQHQADPNICDIYGNTALHIACREGNLYVISCLLSEGADVTIKNNKGNTPLEKCQGAIRNEIVSLFTKYNPKRVLEDVSKWNIEYVEEEQVFQKKDYGVMLIIPPSAVEKEKKVETKVKVFAPEETDIILPPDVELVSCFYKIETTGKFLKPIELYLQHNVELTSQEECEQLAFIKAKGPPPYKFELLPIKIDQEFKPNDNSGVIKVSDFSVFSIVKQKLKSLLSRLSSSSYVMTVFFKDTSRTSWVIQAVVTKNLGPFLKRVSTEKSYESWNKIESVSFSFDPKVNEVISILVNDCYDIKPLKKPCQVTKEAVDKSKPDTALPYLKFKVSLKTNQEVTDLELTFKGMRDEECLVITREELQQIQNEVPAAQSVSKHAEFLSRKEIPNDLLCKEPKKLHLMSLLHGIKHKWDTIGEQLAVKFGDIKSTEYNMTYDSTKKLSEVLQVWIDKKTLEVSWKTIITVIDDPPIENKRVGDEICEFLARSDIQNEYLSTGYSFATFNAPPPITPRTRTNKAPIPPIPAKRKSKTCSEATPPLIPPVPKKRTRIPSVNKQEQELDEMEQETPSQSSNPIGYAAHCLHKQAKQWEEKDNDMIVATKRMARLMMKMSKFEKEEEGDVTSKEDFIQTAKLIVKDSKEVVDIATKVVEVCTDTQLKNTLSKVIDGIPNYATQLKINVDVHARRGGDSPEADKEATRLLTVNAENLMTSVGVVLNTTESALIKVPPEARAHLTGLSWIKKSL